jgi:hypothetical protein
LQEPAGVPPPRLDGLQIEEDFEFQRRSWRVQRVAWLAGLLLLAGAMLGLFGSGPLSRATVDVPGLMRVEYQRFARYETPETLTIHLLPAATGGSSVQVGLDRQYLDRSKVDSIVPPPQRVRAADDRLVYEFDVARPGGALTVALVLEPQRIGWARGRITLERGSAPGQVTFGQFVYP